jgi:6-pyruvoyltetrahydropterin/6-carboxytetrahydropterin synthase
MGRKKLSEHPPEVAARMRADLAQRAREAWAERSQNGLGERRNGALQAEVQERIAASVRHAWEEGRYAERTNGMSGRAAAAHPNWTWGKRDYHAILAQHEPAACTFCGETEGLDVHHVDEQHENYLLTNLQWACVPCHHWRYHYESRGGHVKRPFVTLSKRFGFEYAHILPWHPGKCARLHGHSGHLEVKLRGRIDPNGVVEDFYDIAAAVKTAVVEPLDHRFLNDWLPNPTTEELLILIWQRLESIGLKGLCEVSFSETDTSSATLTAADMIEAFGWDRSSAGEWVLVAKPSA